MRKTLLISSLLFSLAIATTSLTGCALSFTDHATGDPIAQENVEKIVKGKTTLEDIITVFGAPTQEKTMGKKTLYIYKHTRTEGSGFGLPGLGMGDSTERSDTLTITFNESNVVETYNIKRGLEPEKKS